MVQAYKFDTHAEFTKLVASGLPEKQAEAVVDLQARNQITNFVTPEGLREFGENLATKSDLAEVRSELKGDIAEVRTDLKWIIRIGGVIVALLALPVLSELAATLLQSTGVN
ncbi:hypothetical protein [Planktotalea arctica]|uniref:hypothetical protein n=1 Tax=Planktotalea arctica TaxID=1481893 RepID=UPI00321BA163